jgi:predicted alpha/beta-fold hydrolase
VREFDDAITAPCAGYRDGQEYYEMASAKRVIPDVHVPVLLIAAQDDPFVPFASFEAAGVSEVPSIHVVAPKHGGHCGFISNRSGSARFWAEERIAGWGAMG